MIDFINTPTTEVAQLLIGKIISHEVDGVVRSGIIVDTECYMGEVDEASHGFGGKRTQRMEAMFLEGGHIYLYEMRGHILMNFVCGPIDHPEGVMIRAIEPLEGIAAMIQARQTTGPNLTNGPAKLTQALGITMNSYGSLLGDTIHLSVSTPYKARTIIKTSRIGIPNKGEWTYAPLRFYVRGNPYCSNVKKSTLDTDRGWTI